MASEQVDKLITFGKMALEQGWHDQARDHFEQALALDASNQEAMKELARVDEILTRREAIAVEQMPLEERLARIAHGDLSLLPTMPLEEVDIALQTGERLLAKAEGFQYAETRAARVYSGGGGGISFRVAKGVRFHLGSGRGRSHSEQELKLLDVGIFYITTKRYLFIGQKRSIVQPLKKVAKVEVLARGIAISRTGKTKTEHFIGPGITQEDLRGFAAIMEGAIRNL